MTPKQLETVPANDLKKRIRELREARSFLKAVKSEIARQKMARAKAAL